MTNIIKHCRGVKKRNKSNRWIQIKKMIPDFEISKCLEYEVKSKIGSIFVNKKIFEKKSVKVYEIDHHFYEYYKENIQTDENDQEHILFRIGA